jgi:drug/metabolite transporter (DMT)-like permease
MSRTRSHAEALQSQAPDGAIDGATDRGATDPGATGHGPVHSWGLPALIFGAALISFSGIFVKLSEVGPTTTGFYRMALALPFLLAWMLRDGRNAARREWLPRDRRALLLAVLAGLALAADLIAWHWCLHMTTVATATLLGNTAPIWVAIGGFLFLRERFSPLFLFGLALSIVSVWGLVAGGERVIDLRDWLAIGLGLFTGIAYAAYFRASSAARRGLATAQVMFWASLTASIALLPVALLTEDQFLPPTLHGWGIVLGLAVCSQVLGQSAINWAMGHLPAAFSSLTLLMNPLFAAICAWPILGEALTPLQMLSGVGVVIGILLARRAQNGRGVAGNGRAPA